MLARAEGSLQVDAEVDVVEEELVGDLAGPCATVGRVGGEDSH